MLAAAICLVRMLLPESKSSAWSMYKICVILSALLLVAAAIYNLINIIDDCGVQNGKCLTQ